MSELVRLAEGAVTYAGGVGFFMADGNRRIECFVTAEALLARAAVRSLSPHGITACFRKYRADVEEAVAVKYRRREFDRLGRIFIVDVPSIHAPPPARRIVPDQLSAAIARAIAADRPVEPPAPAPATPVPEPTSASVSQPAPQAAALPAPRLPVIDSGELSRPAA
ncbi:MAG: DUF1488 domain-containing protein [Bauldia sp.]